MPRPTNKEELLLQANTNYQLLVDLINSFSNDDINKEFQFEDRDKNIRDVIAHLHEWHNMVESWYNIGTIQMKEPIIPGVGYTWRTLPNLNFEIWKKYQDVELELLMKKFQQSHNEIIEIIKKHSDSELFEKKYYKWTKSSNLAAYFIGNTSAHYTWAINKIKKQKKALKISEK
ncbi:ClbS/DfsB family four-helix bundle protein [Haploplasma axanthum]|uniref:Uncharacterized conserved protein n=1 Tax=Haploplasma axanthum TaxID=29552 RepID=A0A449BC70_HAPAX|nr:ClbS/DfsB family four-helix bundle protein [Haploplasma axanthum]VEU80037.1 Uncharacterized conserved protein [Haploplasma axanthum]